MPKYYRHVFTLEVLSLDDTLDDLDLAGIAYEVENGEASGMFLETTVEEVTQERMAELLINQGSDPEFLLPEVDDDDFICERCACIFDIEDSVKPYGKKGPMLCTSCAEKENVDA